MFLINKLYVNTFCSILHDKYESCVWFLSVNKCACIPNLCFNCWKLHTSCTTSQIHRKRGHLPIKTISIYIYTQSSSNPRRNYSVVEKLTQNTNLSRPEDPHSLRGRFSAARTHHTLCKFSDSSLRGGSHIYIYGFSWRPRRALQRDAIHARAAHYMRWSRNHLKQLHFTCDRVNIARTRRVRTPRPHSDLIFERARLIDAQSASRVFPNISRASRVFAFRRGSWKFARCAADVV